MIVLFQLFQVEEIMTDAAYVLFYLRHDLYEELVGTLPSSSIPEANSNIIEEKEEKQENFDNEPNPINNQM
jgi:hypothetical protein